MCGYLGRISASIFFWVENMRRVELHPVLHEAFVRLHYFHPEVNIDEQHRHEQAYDKGHEEIDHMLKGKVKSIKEKVG